MALFSEFITPISRLGDPAISIFLWPSVFSQLSAFSGFLQLLSVVSPYWFMSTLIVLAFLKTVDDNDDLPKTL